MEVTEVAATAALQEDVVNVSTVSSLMKTTMTLTQQKTKRDQMKTQHFLV